MCSTDVFKAGRQPSQPLAAGTKNSQLIFNSVFSVAIWQS